MYSLRPDFHGKSEFMMSSMPSGAFGPGGSCLSSVLNVQTAACEHSSSHEDGGCEICLNGLFTTRKVDVTRWYRRNEEVSY